VSISSRQAIKKDSRPRFFVLDLNFDDGLLICRLFLGLSKDQFSAVLADALKDVGKGVLAYRKNPDIFLDAIVSLGILEEGAPEIRTVW